MAKGEHDYEQFMTPCDGPITITGRLGRDPELKHYEKKNNESRALCSYSLAVTKYDFKEEKKVTVWTDVTTFGDQAERDAKNLAKGNLVQVVGDLQVKGRDDGKVYFTIIPTKVNYLVWGKDKDEEEEEKPSRRERDKPAASRRSSDEDDEKPRRKITPEKSAVPEGADDADDLYN